jgi:tetratricopeptide (TPR) repeat protein
MWMSAGKLHRAHHWFQIAHCRLPAYAPAQGYLAEVEAEFGETETAINRLMPLTTYSDDPDYCATLARILLKIGRTEEADGWRRKAAGRYNDLISRHPEAFADHAAAFWIEVGSDPHRALSLAKLNLEIRQTPRAKRLFLRAAHSCVSHESAALSGAKSSKSLEVEVR